MQLCVAGRNFLEYARIVSHILTELNKAGVLTSLSDLETAKSDVNI